MNKVPVVFCFDSRIVFGASVAIKSLINSAKQDTQYDIHVLHNGMNSKFVKAFEELCGEKHRISFHFIDKSLFKGVKTNNKSWTEIVYYRMYIPEVLTQYDKVIYSDVDVFFKDDLTEVYNTDIADYEWAGVRAEINNPDTICHKYFEENTNKFIFWSGFMLINCKKMRDEKYFSKFMETAFKIGDRLKFFDLDVINITCNKILPLDLKYCLLEPFFSYEDYSRCKDYKYLEKIYSKEEFLNAKQSPVIIHYAGELGKPWHRKKMPKYYEECSNTIPKELRIFTLRDLRKRFWGKGILAGIRKKK